MAAVLGHDSPNAGLIYHHATSAADPVIAKALGAAMTKALNDDDQDDDPNDGAVGVLARVS